MSSARVTKLVDVADSKSAGVKAVPVRVRPRAPNMIMEVLIYALIRTFSLFKMDTNTKIYNCLFYIFV